MEEKLRILLIDDDEVDRMAVRRALRASQMLVQETGDGATALQMLRQERIDCALLDYRLPDRDGLEVLTDVRRAGVRTPIIMLTGQGDEQLAVDMMKAGANDYLVKGRLSLDVLAQSIRNAVRIHRAEQDAALATEKLRESESRFRSMADSAPVLIWIADTTGRCIYLNKGWLDFTGRAMHEELGDGWATSVHPDDAARCTSTYLANFQRRQPFTMEYRLGRYDGQYRWVYDKGTPLYLPNGTFNGFIGSCIDITERKESEIELQRAKESAEAANRTKDQFLAVLSHELRTPLTPVLTTVMVLEGEPGLPEELRSGLEMIRRNVELEARLIDDLLDLTRISRGKLQLNLDDVDLHSTINNTLEICCSEIRGKRLDIDLDLRATRYHVRADSARIQQVLWNLIKNAVKFTGESGTVIIRTRNEPPHQLVVEVSDTGIGIDADWLPRIFDAFEQGEGAINRQFGGLGLGLAISRALVEMHGGTLSASSAGRDKGATFTMSMEAHTPRPQLSPTEPGQQQNNRKVALRILMVDDHEDTSRAMKRLLERLGYEVETADSVQAALQASARQRFDLLISDIGLPDGSGLDLMRRLKQDCSINGIALSGFGMEEDLQRSREAGFAEHLTKPINFRRLEAAIEQLTARSPQ
jgi:PAS domain S-box-containing protein